MFYVVWNERMWIGATHATLEAAQREKDQLEADNPDYRFVIMQPVEGQDAD